VGRAVSTAHTAKVGGGLKTAAAAAPYSADLRKQQDITQVEMAKALGVSQQTINSYEVGRRRIPVSALATLARTLGVSLEELLGEESAAAAKKRGPAPKLQQQMERIQHLPRAQQRFVMQVIDTVLAQQDR
jgi:transcriptional regulator with XRE-family HTH domain